MKRTLFLCSLVGAWFIFCHRVGAQDSLPGIPRLTPVASHAKAKVDVRPQLALQDLAPALADLNGSASYQIASAVTLNAPFCTFRVQSPHGNYDVTSIYNLRKLCYEIEVIERLRRNPQGSQLLKGMAQSVSGTVRGAGMLVIHPVASVKGIGRSGARRVRGLGRFFFRKNQKGGDGSDRARGGKGFLISNEIRQIAHELQLDAYSDNVNVQRTLRAMAKGRKTGKLAVGLAKSAAPISTGGSAALKAANLSTTPGALDAAYERLLADNGPAELYRILLRKYQQDQKLSPDALQSARRLLANRNYSPREQAYLNLYLWKLRRLNGRMHVLNYLAAVTTPEEAILSVAQLQFLTALQRSGKVGCTEFLNIPGILACRDDRSTLILALPYDVLSESAYAACEPLRQKIRQAATNAKIERFQLWTSGLATQAFMRRMAAQQIEVISILSEPLHAPTLSGEDQ